MLTVFPKNGQIWLICGGRNFYEPEMFNAAMSDLMMLRGCPDCVVHGAALGADRLADEWGKRLALDVVAVPAAWDIHGRGAGPIRNQRMIDEHHPHLVVAFPGGKGTADMVRRARAAGIDVAEIKRN